MNIQSIITMKILTISLLASSLLLSHSSADEKEPSYRFEFKVTKQKVSGDEKDRKKPQRNPPPGQGQGQPPRPGGEMGESESWRYKIQVDNKSLSDIADLEANYTLYVSASKSRGGARGSSKDDKSKQPRTITGETSLEPIARGNRTTFETTAAAIRGGGGRPGGGPPGGGGGRPARGGGPGGGGNGQGGGPQGPSGPEKLDGIKIELFLGDKKVGEYVYGNAAKQAARDKKRDKKRSDRED